MATALSLATVEPVTSGKGDEAAAVSRIAATSPVSTTNVTSLCRSTPYPRACETALTSAEARSARDPFAASVQFAMARATTACALARNLSASAAAPAPVPAPSAMHDCALLLGISLAQLSDALAGSAADADGATTWLSAALTNQGTCRNSLAAVPLPDDPAGNEAVRRQVAALARFISRCTSGRRLLESPSPATTKDDDIVVTPDAVVALDGSGTHTSINEAIAAVTAEVGTEASGGRGAGVSTRRKVIHVKAGRYEESVSISYQQANVMLVGDGEGKTIIDGDRSVDGGYTTWSSATVAAMGAGFIPIAKGVSILNSAGPGQGQAVALLVSGDRSVVYQCEVKGHQDTLFAHSNRQFYADTDVSGTVDFIFGNAAAVLQRCDIQARRPRPGQQDVVTAQGRADPNQNTGFSIHRCRVTGAPDLEETPVYLGRPRRVAGVVRPACAWYPVLRGVPEHRGRRGDGRAGDVDWRAHVDVHGGCHGVHRGEFHHGRFVVGCHWSQVYFGTVIKERCHICITSY
ncbi:unnamed protein product [Miscanthus lutarioriparius]|uniref:Pectinesterase n=1 Tax=Miscanthus lutarioriparius TaxID=422564 RepID=A0A811PJL8_9POAL|nr:unnamed protein product [Miscanthus lutarioriparius]